MATLASKYGPDPAAEPPGAERAAAQLESYERAARSSLSHKEGPAAAPVMQLSDEQLAALFAPRQLDALVRRPLDRGEPGCGPASERPGGERRT
jgi:hypothetical protein